MCVVCRYSHFLLVMQSFYGKKLLEASIQDFLNHSMSMTEGLNGEILCNHKATSLKDSLEIYELHFELNRVKMNVTTERTSEMLEQRKTEPKFKIFQRYLSLNQHLKIIKNQGKEPNWILSHPSMKSSSQQSIYFYSKIQNKIDKNENESRMARNLIHITQQVAKRLKIAYLRSKP